MKERPEDKARRLEAEGEATESTLFAMRTRVAELEAEVARLRGALERYADKRLWRVNLSREGYTFIEQRPWQIADAALATPPAPFVPRVTPEDFEALHEVMRQSKELSAKTKALTASLGLSDEPASKLETGEEAGARLKGRRPAPRVEESWALGTVWTDEPAPKPDPQFAHVDGFGVLNAAGWLSPEARKAAIEALRDVRNDLALRCHPFQDSRKQALSWMNLERMDRALAMLDGAKP